LREDEDYECKWTFNESVDGYWGYDLFDTREEAVEAAKEYMHEEQPIMYIGQCNRFRYLHMWM